MSLHSAVDAAVGSFGTSAEYARYVAGIHRFRTDVESGLKAVDWPKAFGDWRPQIVADLAEQDLTDLGLPARPCIASTFDLGDTSRLAGALYVLEGSSLGARVLYARARALGFSATFGARHLARQADGIESWRGFLALLDDLEDFDPERAVAGAEHVFRHAAYAFESGARHAA